MSYVPINLTLISGDTVEVNTAHIILIHPENPDSIRTIYPTPKGCDTVNTYVGLVSGRIFVRDLYTDVQRRIKAANNRRT